mmetsp:Transcript_26556/g.47065  ORF Transcript_26556/g.47065 Transcript_26556/m.47065 type:complete len:234 (+) Transcript_26556:1111-1812(+)
MADPLVLQLLLLPQLLVLRKLLCKASQPFIEVLQIRSHLFELGPGCLVGCLLLLQPKPHLLHVRSQGLMTLASVGLLALHGQELVSQHLKLNLCLLRLLPLLLKLFNMLFGRLLQLDNLLLEVLDAVLTAGLQAVDVLLELFRGPLQLLPLLWHVGDGLLELLHLGLHLMNRLLRSVVLAAADPVLDQCQLMLLALELAVHGTVLGGRCLHLRELGAGLVALAALLQHLRFHG